MRYLYFFIIMGCLSLAALPVLLITWDGDHFAESMGDFSDATAKLLGLDT